MAGDLFIMSISTFDIDLIKRAGGVLLEQVQHSDRTSGGDYAALEDRIKLGKQRNRSHLPAHCYFVFDRDTFTLDKKFMLVRILKDVSRPLGILKNRADLATWDTDTDVQRCNTLYAAVQNGPVGLEFYKVGLTDVKTAFSHFTMVPEH